MVVVREVQGLEDNVQQLDCDGLALTPICALVTFDTLQHTLQPKATNQQRRQTLLNVKGPDC